jgi:hypothetical protein
VFLRIRSQNWDEFRTNLAATTVHIYDGRQGEDRRRGPRGYKGERVGLRYTSVNKFHTAKPTHASLS